MAKPFFPSLSFKPGDSPPIEQARTATGSARRIEGRNGKGRDKNRSQVMGVVIYAWQRNQTTERGEGCACACAEGGGFNRDSGKERRGRRGWRRGPQGKVVRQPSDVAPIVGSDGEMAGAGPAQTQAQNRPHHRISCPIMCRPVHACGRVKWTHRGADRWGVGPSYCLCIFFGDVFFVCLS